MENFFKLMKRVSDSDEREYTSILELTKDIAMSAGYSLEEYTQKNGKTRIRTVYTKPWDSALVAKWFMFYKNYFVSKLYKLPALKDYFTLILNRTFSVYFNALRLEKLSSDKAVTAYIKMTFSARIGEAMYLLGSINKLVENDRRKQLRKDIRSGKAEELNLSEIRNKCHTSNAFNESMSSLDALKEDINFDIRSEASDYNEVILDLKHKLNGNHIGLRLLECMLYSDKKIVFNNLSNYMEFKDCELEVKDNVIDLKDEVKDQLSASYNTIVTYLKDVYPDVDFSKSKRVFKYSSKDYCIVL